MPERIPFSVSAENFAIVSPGQDAQADRVSGAISEKRTGREVEPQKRRDEDRSGGRRGRATDRRQAERSRPGTSSVIRDAVKEAGGTNKMLSGPPVSGTYYIYSFDGRLLAEYNILGHLVRDYIYFGGQLVAEYRQDIQNFYYYASDQINSTRIVTDSAGTVVYSAAHEPYGEIQKTWGVSTYDPELKFSGKPRDAESELDYFGARYYDRAQYRFLSVDPVIPAGKAVANPQRWNLYAYCLGNPVKYLDPDGAEAIYFIIMRQYIQDNMIHGVMYSVDLKFQASTMEPLFTDGKRGSAIPDGTYSATPGTYMGKFALKLSGTGLEGRNVWIHFGTVREFTTGCFIIGAEYIREEQKMIGSALRLIELENYIKSQMNSLGTATMNQRFFLDEIMLSWLYLDYMSWLMDVYEWKTEIMIKVQGLYGLQGMDH